MIDELNTSIIGIIAFLIIFIAFGLGWLFPVEGPLDYLYDKYASQPAHKAPSSYVPLRPYQFVIDVNDLSEEDFRVLQEIFRNK